MKNILSREAARNVVVNLKMVQAWAEGSTIQYKSRTRGKGWVTVDDDRLVGFHLGAANYRVKPYEAFLVFDSEGKLVATRETLAKAEAFLAQAEAFVNFNVHNKIKYKIRRVIEVDELS